jgi:hypothetical protein
LPGAISFGPRERMTEPATKLEQRLSFSCAPYLGRGLDLKRDRNQGLLDGRPGDSRQRINEMRGVSSW